MIKMMMSFEVETVTLLYHIILLLQWQGGKNLIARRVLFCG